MPSHARRMFKSATLSQVILIACLGVGIGGTLITLPAIAQTIQAQPSAAQRAEYDIPAGNLDRVLNGFAAATGIHLAIDASLTSNLSSPGLQGRYTVDAGLAEILSGTGLLARRQADGSYTLQKLGTDGVITLDPVLVSAEAKENIGTAGQAYIVGDASVGVLGNKTLKDTPYSIEAYSRDLMDNKQARSLADLTKGDASINLMVHNAFAESWLSVRGLEVDFYNAKKLDGMSFSMFLTELPLEHMERVEVLKGAGGFLHGFGTPGGIVNYVQKRPTEVPVQSLSSQLTDSGLALIHGDIGGRVGAGGQLGFRVNLVHESGDTYVDRGESDRTSGSVALDWSITPDLIWRVDALKGEHLRDAPSPWVISNATGTLAGGFSGNARPPAPISGSDRIGPGFGRTYTEYETYGTDLSWQFMPNWMLSLVYREMEVGREYMNGGNILVNADGDYEIYAQNFSDIVESQHIQAMVTGTLKTGHISHDLTLGVSRNKSDRKVSWITGYQDATLGPGNLSNPPTFANPFTRHVTIGEANDPVDLIRRKELFISDTLHFGEDWDLIIGLRRARLEVLDAGYDESATTPTVAAVFRPVSGLSLYGSYIEALEQGETAPTTAANSGEVFPPLESKQYEVGTKAEGDNWVASAALFRLEKGLTYTTPDNIFTQDGEAHYQGLEISGKFRLNPQWLVTGSAMWLDATNQKTDGGVLDGKRIRGVAREHVSLYGEYSVIGLPLTFTAGARYVGKRPVDADNQWHVGSVTLFDAGARYKTRVGNQSITLRLNIDNLTGEDYWVSRANSGSLIQGAPRSIKFGAQIDF